uniref:TGF-beta family profile domain-containing protein n=1 Tax=Amphilophus citrinellus TaxID=61819 RepID=A0A3Q0SN96_AMPCI
MCISHTILPLVTCTLLLLVSTSGEGQPREAHEDTPDADRTDSQTVLLLEAVKTGILSSLGMDTEPRLTQKASKKELREMYQLYRKKIRAIRGNSSQPMGGNSQSTMSTVLFPGTDENLVRQGFSPSVRWYRAVFQKNSNIQTELTVARAELKISRHILGKLTSVKPEVREEIKVKVSGVKSVVSAAWTDPVRQTNISNTQDVTLDISSEVEEWIGTDGQPLVVDVGMANRQALTLTISLELGLVQTKPAQRTRRRRSNKEDDCDERGWCCRKSVTVSFKDIGWTEWVVAPAEYTMHFCDGTCPHNYKPASMHTQVKSRLHQITKGRTPNPCCVPAAYEPMVLMHYDSREKLRLTTFTDLIVSKCYCA